MRKLKLAVACVVLAYSASAILAQENKAVPAKKPLTTESFLEWRDVQDPQFSPDGTKVAFVVSDALKGEKRTRHIWMYEKESKRPGSSRSQRRRSHGRGGRRTASSSRFYPTAVETKSRSILAHGSRRSRRSDKGKSQRHWLRMVAGRTDDRLSRLGSQERGAGKEGEREGRRTGGGQGRETPAPALAASCQSRIARLTDPHWEVKELAWLPDGQSIAVIATNRPHRTNSRTGFTWSTLKMER